MARKNFDPHDLEELEGPMNDVATEDARVYANVDESRELDIHKERRVRAKKQKIKTSSKKADRRLNKAILKNIDDDKGKGAGTS
jgi:hypothetical protein